MAYFIFVRLPRNRVINEVWTRRKEAINRFDTLAKEHKEVSLEKRQYRPAFDNTCTKR